MICPRSTKHSPPRRPQGGSRECRVHAAPAVSCAICTKKCAHEHTGEAEASGIPCAMVLRLMARSPATNSFLSPSPLGLTILRVPVGLATSPRGLTSATDARTTRFCRTQQSVFAKRLRRTLAPSSCADDIAHGKSRPAIRSRADAAASTAFPAYVRDDGQRPSARAGLGELVALICPTAQQIFLIFRSL